MAKRQYRWRPLDAAGFEILEIDEDRTGIHARGMMIGTWNEVTSGALYHIALNPDWTFRALDLALLDDRKLALRADQGSWTDGDGVALPELDGCIDIDLSGSPFTNTPPIRRADFSPGVAQRFRTAFVALDRLAVMPREQIYTQADDNHFRFQSVTSGGESILIVDEDGFVISYPELYQRVEE